MLQDTSFAIHPGKTNKLENSTFLDIGNMTSSQFQDGIFKAICDNGTILLQFYRADILRIEMVSEGNNSHTKSRAVVLEKGDVEVNFKETESSIILTTANLTVELRKNPFRVSVYDQEGRLLVNEDKKGIGVKYTGEVICYKEMMENDYFYGFGEKTGFLNKRGEKLQMWNTDVYAPHNPETDSLYQSIPFFITFRNGQCHGLFLDNPSKTVFDLKSEETHYSIQAEIGNLDYYIFAGPSMKDVLEQYSALTGRMPIPPKWALGYHQSRYSYETEDEVIELVRNFKEKNIPIDVVHLDIHYMDEYRVFTFNKDRFPNPKRLIQELKKLGIKVVPIVDPGVKEDPEYSIYKEGVTNEYFCKYIEGNIYFGDVWPGNSAFPDFTKKEVREWWGDKYEFYTNLGVEGIWNDMNEPAVFNETKTMDLKVMHDNDGEPKTHRELHNIYGLTMSESTYEGMKKLLNGKRPFVLTRAGYSGVQRYAAVWTGDNRSFWEHLQMSLPMVMNLGLSGIPFSGPDVGGFAHDSNGELLARWTQVGAFTPFFRNHSAIGFARQEPWAFGKEVENIVKKYIQLRYVWMPQIYTLFAEAHETGMPIMRPLVLEFPEDQETYNLYDQFMIGDNVIVAPILHPSKTKRVLYLPKGRWVDYWTNEVLEGNKHHLIEADLSVLPIYVKEGSIVAHGTAKSNMQEKEEELTLHLYNSSSESNYTFALYEDDGQSYDYEQGKYIKNWINIKINNKCIQLETNKEGTYAPEWKTIKLAIHNYNNEQLLLNGEAITLDSNGVYLIKL